VRLGKRNRTEQPATSAYSSAGVYTMPAVRASVSWQMGGYHGEITELNSLEGIHDGNDRGYVPVTGHDYQDVMLDPFGDFAVDPSMASERSENLVGHHGTFWQDAHKRSEMSAKNGTHPVKTTATERAWHSLRHLVTDDRHAFNIILICIAVIAILLTIARWMIFNVGTVTVQFTNPELQRETVGQDQLPQLLSDIDQAKELSEIEPGMNILSLNEDAIAANIARNRYYILVGMDTRIPHEVVLRVRKRNQEAFIQHLGIIYIIDQSGMVLEETSDGKAQPDMIEVRGLDIHTCVLGKHLIMNRQEQLSIYGEILLQLRAMNMQSGISRIFLNDIRNICMVTKDGYSVRFGGSERMHAKLRSMALTIEKLKEAGKTMGTIDVSTPETPTYIPENIV